MIPKFRAWDKWNKKMWYSHEVGESVKLVDKVNKVVIDDFVFWLKFDAKGILKAEIRGREFMVTDDPFPMYDCVNHELELLQFTGLKDRNGVEIYEGDIIKNLEFDFPSEVVKWGKCNIGCNGFEYAFMVVGPYVEEELTYSAMIEGNVEVIGNIYENPELLEVEE